MNSMNLIDNGCQETPDLAKGIVFALDISKKEIVYRICRIQTSSLPITVNQTMNGFKQIETEINKWRKNGYDIWVGYEPTGPYSCGIIEFLMGIGCRIAQINPKHTSMFNDIRDNKQGKTDPRDTNGIGCLIWQGCYRKPVHLTGTYAELRTISAEWLAASVDGARLRNQLYSAIELWYPELGMVYADKLCQNARAIIRKYRTAEEIAKAGEKKVKSTLKKVTGGRYANRAEELVRLASDSRALKSSQETRYQMILDLLDRFDLIEKQQKYMLKKMESLLGNIPESKYILSVKGIGVVTAAFLIGECGNIGNYSMEQLEKLVGLNLYEYSSGQHKGKQHISKGGRSALRYAVCMVATCMTSRNGIYHDVAEEMRARGMNFGQIRIAVARKLLRLISALVRKKEFFDLERFVARRKTVDDPLTRQDARIQKNA